MRRDPPTIEPTLAERSALLLARSARLREAAAQLVRSSSEDRERAKEVVARVKRLIEIKPPQS